MSHSNCLAPAPERGLGCFQTGQTSPPAGGLKEVWPGIHSRPPIRRLEEGPFAICPLGFIRPICPISFTGPTREAPFLSRGQPPDNPLLFPPYQGGNKGGIIQATSKGGQIFLSLRGVPACAGRRDAAISRSPRPQGFGLAMTWKSQGLTPRVTQKHKGMT